jgi:hypothetical protein
MTAWEHYWFGPVATVRPCLLMKAVYGLLALDLWLVQIPLGGRYGAGGFNVAHFRWLDVVQPLPSPGFYVGLVLSLGLLALVCALSDPGRWARALVAVLHTYSWAMSLHDAYQHHYFLSLALAAFVFFPRVPVRALAAPGDEGESTVSAWAYVLLGVNVGLVYAFTALAKLDPTWRAGEILQLDPHTLFATFAGWAQGVGIPSSLFWRTTALAVVTMEGVVAVGYLVAARRDDPGRPWVRMVTWLSFLLAVGVHVSAEVILRIRIGWFSYYMLIFACAYLLPSAYLRAVAAPLQRLAAKLEPVRGRADPATSGVGGAAVVAVAALIVAGVGFALDLPGARAAGIVAASVLVGAALVPRVVGRHARPLPHVVATALAAVSMWATVAGSNTRFDYYMATGLLLERLGDRAAALDAFESASRYGSVSLQGVWRSDGTTLRVNLRGSDVSGVFVDVSEEARRLGFKPGDVSFVASAREDRLEGYGTVRYGTLCHPNGRRVPMIGLRRSRGDILAVRLYRISIDSACQDTGEYTVIETLWERVPGAR